MGGVQTKIYIARLYFKQNFEWGKEKDTIEDDVNQLAGLKSKRYFSLAVGKFGMADFFDGNNFSHDPRSQFMNWALMDNGAWDYPANTRGYVLGTTAELGQPAWTIRFAFTMVTTQANQSIWDSKIGKANTKLLNLKRRYTLSGQKGTLRLLAYLLITANLATIARLLSKTRLRQMWIQHRHTAGINMALVSAPTSISPKILAYLPKPVITMAIPKPGSLPK